MKNMLPFLVLAFSPALFADDEALAPQEGCRHKIIHMSRTEKILSPYLENDRAEDLIDEPHKMVKSLKVMEEKKFLSGKAAHKPWSDSYWPIAEGGIAQRYNDRGFVNGWEGGQNYVLANPAEALISSGKFEDLSPAEKYDVILGLSKKPLTKNAWEEGRSYFERDGQVEYWMGHCHGWAAASIMMSEPKKTVELDTFVGKAVLYPSDIKALATGLWSNGNFPTKFIGGRCNSKNPRVDNQGRSRENDCLDTNPGTWHLAVINQIGVSKRAFVMDASADYEVWNQPVYSYEYTYINPKTLAESKTLAEAVVKKGEWRDKKASFRARNMSYVVGVKMKVVYISENTPSKDEDQETYTSDNEYSYDLELDSNFEIVGGEWENTTHPDFLWVPALGSFPYTTGDQRTLSLDYKNISQDQRRFAQVNAEQGLPWGPVVRDLFKRSSRVR